MASRVILENVFLFLLSPEELVPIMAQLISVPGRSGPRTETGTLATISVPLLFHIGPIEIDFV